MQNLRVMGIINITPDSFYDGRNNLDLNSNRIKLNKMISADIIDVGCESSRPGASSVKVDEEIERLKTFIPLIKEYPNKIFSIDTYKYETALYAVNNGFKIINSLKDRENLKENKFASREKFMTLIQICC